jgi:hypothetical protein
LYGSRARRRRDDLADTGTHLRADTGTRLRSVPSPDTGEFSDTGSRLRHDDDGGARHQSGGVAAGPWRDLTRQPRRRPENAVRYDPAAQQSHDLDPAARQRSLPLYPAPDPSWTQTSGRHAALGDAVPGDAAEPDRDARRGRRTDTGADTGGDTGAHHRIEPGEPGYDGTRDVGGRRRRLESWERRPDGRPDLTVIPGERWQPQTREPLTRESRRQEPGPWERRTPDAGRRPGHLRAIPGERRA